MWNQKKRKTMSKKGLLMKNSVRKKQRRSALSEPQGTTHWCDNRCTEKALRYMQIASMVTEEGGEARTINLCKQCYNERLVQQGKQPLNSKEWKEVLEKKAHPSRLWKVFGSEQFLCRMLEYFTPRKIPADAAQEKTRRKANRCLLLRSFGASQKEVRIQIAVTRQCAVRTAQRSRAIGNGPLRGFRRPMTRLVAMEDISRLSIAQEIL